MRTRADLVLFLVVFGSFISSAARAGDASSIVGRWHGTSTCVDKKVDTACKDEEIVYDFTPGESAGSIHQSAFKVIDGAAQVAAWQRSTREFPVRSP